MISNRALFLGIAVSLLMILVSGCQSEEPGLYRVAIWKIWDDFKIDQSRMSGFWEEDPLVETGEPMVKATAYIHKEKVLAILPGNYLIITHFKPPRRCSTKRGSS